MTASSPHAQMCHATPAAADGGGPSRRRATINLQISRKNNYAYASV